MKPLTLSELTLLIKQTIDISFDSYITIVAEINQLNVNYSGHAYLQLVEKKKTNEAVVASIRAIIWANKYNLIKEYFKSVTGSQIKEGIKIMAKVEVNFHSIYGLSLFIHDIDPTYTLGDVEKNRQEIINRLEQDGIIEMNKKLQFPLVPQNIAIISSTTAAGLEDFLEHLTNNDYGFAFNYQLFEAVMQGDKTEKSIIAALDNIFNKIDEFDIAVIIRGGGSKLDLSSFDSYEIAFNISQFPLPVLAGIGHERDASITDFVAHKSLKTPTAVADFIINKTAEFQNKLIEKYKYLSDLTCKNIDRSYDYVLSQQNNLKKITAEFLFNKKLDIFDSKQNLKQKTIQAFNNAQQKSEQKFNILNKIANNRIFKHKDAIQNKYNFFNNSVKNFISDTENYLKILNSKIENLDPKYILNLGYSITYKNGKIVKSLKDLNKDDVILTKLKHGEFKSIVK